jgi:hypothetical protein
VKRVLSPDVPARILTLHTKAVEQHDIDVNSTLFSGNGSCTLIEFLAFPAARKKARMADYSASPRAPTCKAGVILRSFQLANNPVSLIWSPLLCKSTLQSSDTS